MPFSFNVPMLDGSVYTVKRLLADGETNYKIAKSDNAGLGIITKSLSLAPAWASGFNLCTSASHACATDCLFTAGRAQIHPRTIQPARIAKSRFLRLNPITFREQLEKELQSSIKTATRKGLELAIRLNVLSDVMWEREFPGLIQRFNAIQFYDYTKHYKRMLRYLNSTLPANYHLTFSWSGKNESQCVDVLNKGGNVAIPFHIKRTKPLPLTFLGYPVIDGDVTDLRFLDPQGGKIVGLRAKGKARKDFESGFVVNVA